LVVAGTCKSVRAEALGIERKNIYRTSLLQRKDEALAEKIRQVHQEHKAYGHRRVAWELGINHKRAARVMKKFGLKPPRRKVSYYTTRSTSHHSYTNLIKDRVAARPHELWCSDVSYLKFQGRFWYLATIEDLMSRQIVAARVSKHHDSYLVLSTLKQALRHAKPEIFHSDQGSEFMAKICTSYLEEKGVQISVSDKASPWQNGYQESFFGRFKQEFGDINRFDHVGELIEEIYSQIHYYNHERRHTATKVAPIIYARMFSDNCHQKMGA
jgi:transposase InsO family protein